MPLDANIYAQLGSNTRVAIKTPNEHLEDVAKIRQTEAAAEWNEAKAAEERRKTTEEQTFMRIMHDTAGDWEKASPLVKKHAPNLYPVYVENLGKARKETFAGMKAETEAKKAEADIGLSMLTAALAGGPELFASLQPVIKKHLPEMAASGVLEQYNPEQIQALIHSGRTAKESLDAQDKIADAVAKGDYRYLAGAFAQADSPEEWAETRNGLHDAGVSWGILDGYGKDFTPGNVRRVQALAMTENERQQSEDRKADNLRQQATQAETGRHNLATERQSGAVLGETRRHNVATEKAAAERLAHDKSTGAAIGAPSLPPEYANALDRVTLNMAANRKPAVIALAERLGKAGDTEQIKQVIRQAAVETEPVDSRNQIIGRLGTASALLEIKTKLRELKAAGVSTNLLTGSVEDVARKLGATSDPRLARIGSQIRDSFIQYRRSITGAAFSEVEGAEYERLAPGYSNTLQLNEALIDGLIDSMASKDREFWTRKLGQQGAELVGALPKTGGNNRPATSQQQPQGGSSAAGSAWERYQQRQKK